MNLLTIAHRAAAHIYSAELTAAAVLEQRPLARRIMLGWYHRATAPRIVAAAESLIVTAALFPSATSSIILLALAAVGYARIADKSHEVINEEERPCHLCPASSTGNGGVWLDWDGNDFPTAPAPMDDFDDDRVRTMAGDLDAQLAALVQEVRP